jgi:exodeoxyribonuclease VII large subunit
MPLADVVLTPSPVQGVEAPLKLVEALRSLNRVVRPEVILLARGGGSIEDLWAFNDERLVRAVCESQAPVITGVGHETDFTLADFAADLRAPTPTAAAELATAITVLELQQGLVERSQILTGYIEALFERNRTMLEGLQRGLRLSSPQRRVQTERQRVDEMSRRGNAAQVHRLELAGAHLVGLENRLMALSPLAVLKRGYAVVTKNKRVIASKSQVQDGDALRVRLQDGDFGARVTGKG